MPAHDQRPHLAHQVPQPSLIQQYEVLLLTHPNDPGYSVICPALGCASQGDTRVEALEMISEAMGLCLYGSTRDHQEQPYDPDAMDRMATDYEHQGCTVEKATAFPPDWDAEIHRWSSAILTDPNNPAHYVARGNVNLNKGENHEALADYNSAISLAPDYADAHFRRGDAHFNLRNYNQAIADYNAALQRNPQHKLALSGMDIARHFLQEQQGA